MKYFKVLPLLLILVSYPVIAQENGALYDALALAYQNNPTIKAARAEFLAVKEKLPQAQSGFLPNITADADVTHTDTDAKGSSFIVSNGGNTSKSMSFNVNQPLYRGGSTQADVRQAQNIIAAQQFHLSAVEQGIIYNAVVAYMDLYQDQAVLELRENDVGLVTQELAQAQARFTVGELTKTDVSQSEARLAGAKAGVINARAAVKADRAVFSQVVGSPPPANIGYPILKFEMPATLDTALELAQSNNREVIKAKLNKQAAASRIDSVKGELLPQISAIGRLNKVYDQSDFIEEQRQASVGLSASVPLYTGGATRSRIREARKTETQLREQINVVQESVKQQVISHWEGWLAAKAETKARLAQVDASVIAQEGVHYEIEFGERTTLDALNANQELLVAQVELVKSKRNEIVARFAIAQSLGLLVPQNLGFSTAKP